MKNFLEFSEDGKTCTVKFSNGAESLEIESKHDGIQALADMARQGKITEEEFITMAEQIMDAENLPLIGDVMVVGIGFPLEILFELLDLPGCLPDEPIEETCLKVCECGKRSKIYTPRGWSSELMSKEHALACLNWLKEDNHVTEEEFSVLKKSIQESSLPED